jgi:hypothetical protein
MPLDTNTGIIPWRGDAKHSIHGQDAGVNVLPVEIAAKADLLYLNFIGAEDFSRTAHGIVFRMVEILYVMNVHNPTVEFVQIGTIWFERSTLESCPPAQNPSPMPIGPG